MTPSEAVTSLKEFYARRMSDGMITFYRGELQGIPPVLLSRAVAQCKRESIHFPTIQVLNRFIAGVREIDARNANLRQAKAPTEFVSTDPEHAKEAFKLLREAMLSYKTQSQREELLAGMHMMDHTWPGVGWGLAAATLGKAYEAKR